MKRFNTSIKRLHENNKKSNFHNSQLSCPINNAEEINNRNIFEVRFGPLLKKRLINEEINETKNSMQHP